ncbi:hypothetical protein ABIC83_002538 [Roseateles asaccharophilus]|uniref:hypothetical protein n=1 Tax=Roseateles asaccharophilus TaxID=582607 RepID=UPI003835D900
MSENEIVAALSRALEQHHALTAAEFAAAFAQELRQLVASLPVDARAQALQATAEWADDKPTPTGLWAAVNQVFFEHGLPQEFPTFLDDSVEVAAPEFTHVRTASARELFGVQDGESLADTSKGGIEGAHS